MNYRKTSKMPIQSIADIPFLFSISFWLEDNFVNLECFMTDYSIGKKQLAKQYSQNL